MKKTLFSCLMCIMSLSATLLASCSKDYDEVDGVYVDLGLPSGTMWKDRNESCGVNGYFTYDEAVSSFGKKLPTKEQCEELYNLCDWGWTGQNVVITGPNGNSIELPAMGYRASNGDVLWDGEGAYYWSSTSSISGNAYNLHYWRTGGQVGEILRNYGHPIRLVKK